MQLRILALAAALIGAVSVPPASAQNQGKRDLKAQQKVEEEAEKRQELLEEVQPMADRFAEAMVTRKYLDGAFGGATYEVAHIVIVCISGKLYTSRARKSVYVHELERLVL